MPVLLPFEVLFQIYQLLSDPRDLASCSQVNRYWRQATFDGRLWAYFCQFYWVPSDYLSTSMPNCSWKEREKDRYSEQLVPTDQARQVFFGWYQEFQGYHSMYPRVKRLCHHLTLWLRQNSSATSVSFQPGNQNWRQLIEKLELGVDDLNANESLKAFILQRHFIDGQKPRMPHLDLGVFGTFTCNEHFTSVFMVPNKYLTINEVTGTFNGVESVVKFSVFAVCPRSGFFYAICTSHSPISPINNADKTSNNWSLVGHVIRLNTTHKRYYSYGPFLGWLEEYLGRLLGGQHDVYGRDRSISMFINDNPPYTSHVISSGILCQASSILLIESQAQETVWSYRIKLRLMPGLGGNTAGQARECQLLERYWIIRYQSGYIEYVRGSGVVGEFPILNSQGQSTHIYMSLVTSRFSEDGTVEDYPASMEGYYTFINGHIDDHQPMQPLPPDTFSVKIAPFSFQCPQSYRMLSNIPS